MKFPVRQKLQIRSAYSKTITAFNNTEALKWLQNYPLSY